MPELDSEAILYIFVISIDGYSLDIGFCIFHERKDNEGQTPLHYAVVCEREALAQFLMRQNADIDIKDNDGNTPRDICDSDWPWMKCPAEKTD